LYSEPIFLLDVKSDDSETIYTEQKDGAEEHDDKIKKFSVSLPTKVTKSKELIYNISKFADSTEQAKSAVSLLLRDISRGAKIDINVSSIPSIKEKILNACKLVFDTHVDGKYKEVNFTLDPFSEVDKHLTKSSNISIVDFDISTQENAQIAAVLKQMFFGHKSNDAIFTNELDIIKYMEKKNYSVSIYNKIVFYGGLIPIYCMMFSKNDK
jgi:hypothetical protein